jgi:hypothetical protein
MGDRIAKHTRNLTQCLKRPIVPRIASFQKADFAKLETIEDVIQKLIGVQATDGQGLTNSSRRSEPPGALPEKPVVAVGSPTAVIRRGVPGRLSTYQRVELRIACSAMTF